MLSEWVCCVRASGIRQAGWMRHRSHRVSAVCFSFAGFELPTGCDHAGGFGSTYAMGSLTVTWGGCWPSGASTWTTSESSVGCSALRHCWWRPHVRAASRRWLSDRMSRCRLFHFVLVVTPQQVILSRFYDALNSTCSILSIWNILPTRRAWIETWHSAAPGDYG
jgi:hypothetical protein